MKKLLFGLVLLFATQANAQLKSIHDLEGQAMMPFNVFEKEVKKKQWKSEPEGRMDTLNYTRFVPVTLNEKNLGDCYMVFYKKKNGPIDYIVYQTINEGEYKRLYGEAKKAGYKHYKDDKAANRNTEILTKEIFTLNVMQGKETPESPFVYVFGIKLPPPSNAKAIPSKVAPINQKVAPAPVKKAPVKK